ncbi:MAG TPA: S1/P1 nuclease [Pyrinomonadaceae bacterium]|nr:S1/P1 nuclease [Chloracidobacterium sp.]MBP9934959.1 S1/P1 nuclease [Pyrinomonadaceae bacterium]MBK7801413.1 S1/P1 nuclease [Chloracidobacterium sp.]MBL0241723.1 S1/P1 nuclease [Chloracidobacterium sp.]HQX54309.1 S1/P1 nuclease [Pyrinomonadaceae bacterium]
MATRAIRTFILISIIAMLSFPIYAWDETGHKITAYIAWQRMTPETRDKVFKILLAAPEDSQIGAYYLHYGSRSEESRKREFFMMIATWPDIIKDKNLATRFKKYSNSNWHYADSFWTWKNGKAEMVESTDKNGLAMDKLAEFNQLIRGDASDTDKAVAIAWLEHLIGDIHQPLHTSGKVTDSNPKGDQGGNLFFLTPKGTPRAQQENLHSFWDSIVAQNVPNAKDQCDADYLDPIADEIIKLYPYSKLESKIAADKFDVWQKESLTIATTDIYKDVKFFQLPSEKYRKQAFSISEERLALAGYRMADLFNEVFGKPAAAK